MKLKIPPAILTLIFGSAMWFSYQYIAIDLLEIDSSPWFALALLSIGGLFGLLGLIQFYNNSTSIDPHKPDKASHLVTDGIYSISRNPMYVALVLFLASWGFYLGNLLMLLLLPLFVGYMNRYQIIPEEEVMTEKFGDEYLNYKSEVRRWL